MPILTHVKKARKDVVVSGKVVIKKGESYWWIRDRFKERQVYKNQPTPYQVYKYEHPTASRARFKRAIVIDEITDMINIMEQHQLDKLLKKLQSRKP